MKKLGVIILSTGLLVGGISFSALACSSGPVSYGQNANQAYYHVMPTISNNQYYGPQQHPEWFQPGGSDNREYYRDQVPGFNNRLSQPGPQFVPKENQPPKFDRNDMPWLHPFFGAPGPQHPMGQPSPPVNQYNHHDWEPGYAH